MLLSLKAQPVIRNDVAGSGAFKASRGDRPHYGVDYLAFANQPVLVSRRATLVKFGQAYSETPRYQYAELQDGDLWLRYFYVSNEFSYRPGDILLAGASLGLAQDVGQWYANGMQDHVHVGVFYRGDHQLEIPSGIDFVYHPTKNRTYIDPEAYFSGKVSG